MGKRKKREEKWEKNWQENGGKVGKLANKAIKSPSPMERHKK